LHNRGDEKEDLPEQACRAANHQGAAIQTDGGYFAILSLVFGDKGMRIVHSKIEARDAVDKAHKEGADFIKLFLQYNELLIPAVALPTMSDEELSTVRYEADNFGLVTAVHHTTIEGFRRIFVFLVYCVPTNRTILKISCSHI
jgi:imidazolonepropionase-like amidohydrolase